MAKDNLKVKTLRDLENLGLPPISLTKDPLVPKPVRIMTRFAIAITNAGNNPERIRKAIRKASQGMRKSNRHHGRDGKLESLL